MKKKKDGYLISCIIPCYNVGLYLEEAIESIIKQVIGFEKIELILVNDGSNDNTNEICEKYKKIYSNVVYINQKNSGVSIARNNGINSASGKYLTFLDGDDIWDIDAFKKGIKLLDSNSDIDFVAFRVHQFEGVDKYHALDYKFDRDKIVDINEDITMIQTQVVSAIYRREFISKYSFDPKIKYAEDVKFMSDLLFEQPKFGIISTSCYNARKRANSSSAVQTQITNIDWYTVTVKEVFNYIFNKSTKKYGKVLDYYQILVLYELQWRFFTRREDLVLKGNDLKKYYNSLVKLLKQCDDKNILLVPVANDYKKRKLLEIKHNGNIYDSFKIRDNSIYFDDVKIMDKSDLFLRLEDIKSYRKTVKMKLKFNMFVTSDLDIYINGNKVKCSKRKDVSNLMYDEREFFVDIADFSCTYYFRKKIDIYTIIDGKKCNLQVKFSSSVMESFNNNGYYKLNYGKLLYKNDKMIIKRF